MTSNAEGEAPLMTEVEHVDPLEVSENYYDKAIKDLNAGFILDGLVSLHISKGYLVGPYAPVHNKINRKKHPLDKTLEELDMRIATAKARLRSYGPIKNPDMDSAGSDSDSDLAGQHRLDDRS